MSNISTTIKAELSEAFNKARRYKIIDGQKVAILKYEDGFRNPLPDLDFCQPPVDFEKRTGMSGLSGQYVLPSGLSSRELQEYAHHLLFGNDSRFHDKLGEVWSELKKCNPETLGQLKFDANDKYKLYDAVLGVASAFNSRDIQVYLDGLTGSGLEKNNRAMLLANKIEICCGPIGWVPGMHTLQSMNLQLGKIKRPVTIPPPKRPVLGPPLRYRLNGLLYKLKHL